MIGRILGLFPTGILTKLAVYVLVGSICYMAGNHHATERALQRELQASADRQRENHKQLLAWKAETETKLKADYEQERRADQIAHELYQRTIRETQAARNAALAALSKERDANAKLMETNNGILAVNENLAEAARRVSASDATSSPGCVMPPVVRNAINDYIDSINSHPTVTGAEGIAPGLSVSPNTSSEPLTCQQLAAGVTNILEHDAMLTAWVLSFQAWEVEIAR